MKFTTLAMFEEMNSHISVSKTITEVSLECFLFLHQGCKYLNCIVDLFSLFHELVSAQVHTFLKLTSSVHT